MKMLAVAILSLLYSTAAIGSTADSLERALKQKGLSNSEQLQIFSELGWNYLETDREKSTYYSRKGIELAKATGNWYLEANCYCTLGSTFEHIYSYDSALFYFNKALNIGIDYKNEDLEARCYGSIGNVYNWMGNDHTSLHYYIQALAIFEKNNWRQSTISAFINIGILYVRMGNAAQALTYFDRAEAMADKNNFTDLGLICEGKANAMLNNERYREALDYASKADEFYSKTGNVASSNKELLAKIYLNGFGNLNTAKRYAQEALNAVANKKGNSLDKATTNNLFSKIFFEEGRYAESEQYAINAQRADTNNIYTYADIVYNLARAQIALGKIDDALSNLEHYRSLIGIRANKNYQAAMTDMEVRYETDKKMMKISALQQQKRMYTWITATSLFIMLLILTIVLFRYRILKQKSQLIATQAAIEGETSERSRLAKDLHDGLGSMLSAIKMNLAKVKSQQAMPNDNAAYLTDAASILDNSIIELRRIAHHMMPESLIKFGLKSSLEDFAQSISCAKFHFYGTESRYESNIETAVYRSAHELVNNALKHANASEINIQLILESSRIALSVIDNGVGFDTKGATKGMGISNIKNRISVYNGIIEIISSKGKGTEAAIEITIKA